MNFVVPQLIRRINADVGAEVPQLIVRMNPVVPGKKKKIHARVPQLITYRTLLSLS
jgi:hypothetical protein